MQRLSENPYNSYFTPQNCHVYFALTFYIFRSIAPGHRGGGGERGGMDRGRRVGS